MAFICQNQRKERTHNPHAQAADSSRITHHLKSENPVVDARRVMTEVNALSVWKRCILVDDVQGFVAGKLPFEALHERRREVVAEQPVDKGLEHPSLDEISSNIRIDRDALAIDFVKYQT